MPRAATLSFLAYPVSFDDALTRLGLTQLAHGTVRLCTQASCAINFDNAASRIAASTEMMRARGSSVFGLWRRGAGGRPPTQRGPTQEDLMQGAAHASPRDADLLGRHVRPGPAARITSACTWSLLHSIAFGKIVPARYYV